MRLRWLQNRRINSVCLPQLRDKNDNDDDNGAGTFKCSDAATPDYDETNGAKSPRNAAWRWALEAIAFLNTHSSNQVIADKDVS